MDKDKTKIMEQHKKKIYETPQVDQDLVDPDVIVDEEQNTSMICTIIDKCRTCSFKELQLMPECLKSGYRLIKRCVKKYQSSNSIVEDKYINEACEMFSGTLEEYNSDPKNQIGNFAEPGSEPHSLFRFMFITGFLALAMTWFLNKRKERILNEVYSKISIVDR